MTHLAICLTSGFLDATFGIGIDNVGPIAMHRSSRHVISAGAKGRDEDVNLGGKRGAASLSSVMEMRGCYLRAQAMLRWRWSKLQVDMSWGFRSGFRLTSAAEEGRIYIS